MGFLKDLKGKFKEFQAAHSQGRGSEYVDAPGSSGVGGAPPEWTAAPEISHRWGKWNEAPDEEYQAGEDFCNENPMIAPRILPSHVVDRINSIGCKAWGVQYPTTPRFSGQIRNTDEAKGGPAVVTITTSEKCKDTSLLSDLPILAGLYDVHGKQGVYYEVLIQKMEGFVAVGTACRPYPEWRMPGWNRLSEHRWGKWNEAPDEEYQAGEDFCNENPMIAPRILPSHVVDRINSIGCKAWGIQYPTTPRFSGQIRNTDEAKGGPAVVTITTSEKCKDTSLLSDLPILAGLYDIHGKQGVYYEVLIQKMEGFVAVGTACRPYPEWRMPGWNRLSAGLHLDDLRKFLEDPDGGRDYVDSNVLSRISAGDTIGCGYEFATGSIFYTHNGLRLPNAFTGVYLPRPQYDVFAAIGVSGEREVQVTFGAEVFRWKEGNEWAWRVQGHVGKLTGGPGPYEEELPAYS